MDFDRIQRNEMTYQTRKYRRMSSILRILDPSLLGVLEHKQLNYISPSSPPTSEIYDGHLPKKLKYHEFLYNIITTGSLIKLPRVVFVSLSQYKTASFMLIIFLLPFLFRKFSSQMFCRKFITHGRV